MSKSSFPYRSFDRKPHPNIVRQILEDQDLMEQMKEILIRQGRPCPFCHRKIQREDISRDLSKE